MALIETIWTIWTWIFAGGVILAAIRSAVFTIIYLYISWSSYMELEEASSNPNTRAKVIKDIVVHIIAAILNGGFAAVIGYISYLVFVSL